MVTKKNKSAERLPPWIRVKISCGSNREDVNKILADYQLNTVCRSARCPNLGECWHRRTATFMILGDKCTRDCKFCAVKHCEYPPPPPPDEARRVAKAAKEMGLEYVVVTSVTRDDLDDGGASQFATVIRELYDTLPGVKVEVLTPDFKGDINSLKTVLEENPTVFNHNVETVERLSKKIRSRANYKCSLSVLSSAFKECNGKIPIKSGLMVGMGETDAEVEKTICELHNCGVTVLTIGQYLQPTSQHWPVARYVEPDKFEYWRKFAKKTGFTFVASAPLVRSSYNASEVLKSKTIP